MGVMIFFGKTKDGKENGKEEGVGDMVRTGKREAISLRLKEKRMEKGPMRKRRGSRR